MASKIGTPNFVAEDEHTPAIWVHNVCWDEWRSVKENFGSKPTYFDGHSANYQDYLENAVAGSELTTKYLKEVGLVDSDGFVTLHRNLTPAETSNWLEQMAGGNTRIKVGRVEAPPQTVKGLGRAYALAKSDTGNSTGLMNVAWGRKAWPPNMATGGLAGYMKLRVHVDTIERRFFRKPRC